jgi:hypothetical protein
VQLLPGTISFAFNTYRGSTGSTGTWEATIYSPSGLSLRTGAITINATATTVTRTFSDMGGPGSGTVELGPYAIIFRPDDHFPTSSTVVLSSSGYSVSTTTLNPSGYTVRDGTNLTLQWIAGPTGTVQKDFFYVAAPDPAP